MNVLNAVKKTIRDRELIVPGEKVLVGVSGGADSVFLLYALKELGFDVRALHVNHGLRGRASERDAAFVERLCRTWQVPCQTVRVRVSRLSSLRSTGLEEAGRGERYRLFLERARRFGCGTVATGHTLNDQAETMLFHVARGSGLKGLAGIPWERSLGSGVRVVRPLLGLDHGTLTGFLKAEGIPWREDATNRSLKFARNRIRWNVLPSLAAVNPQVLEHLGELAGRVGREEKLWEKTIQILLPKVSSRIDGKLILDRAKFLRYPVVIKPRLLKAFLDQAVPVGSKHLRQAERFLVRQGSGRISLPEGWVLEKAYDRIVLFPALESSRRWSQTLSVPGRVILPGTRVSLEARLSSPQSGFKPKREEAVFDWDALSSRTLRVRSWKAGDRFSPDGLGGKKKLSDFFIDAKIPRFERPNVPLVCAGREILWIAPYRRGAEAKLSERTKRVLTLALIANRQVKQP